MPDGMSPAAWMAAPSAPGRVTSIPTIAPSGAMGAAGAGGPNEDIIKKLLATLQAQTATANAAKDSQYNSLLGSVGNTKASVLGAYDQAGTLLQGQGASAKQDIADTLVNQNGKSEQDLINRGLGNTTIRSSVLRGNQTAATKASSAVDENIAAQNSNLLTQKAGALGNLGNLEADSILSKSIQGPDMSQYLALLQQLGQNGGAGAGGGGGGFGGRVNASAPRTTVVRSAGLSGAGR